MLRQEKTRLEELSQAIEQEPGSAHLLIERGQVHMILNDLVAAKRDYEKVIEIDPSREPRLWQLGVAYYLLGQWPESARQFVKYYTIDPRDREDGIWKFLADAKQGGIENARAHMLHYTEFDRQPFPALYAVYAGEMSPDDFLAELAARKLDQSAQVQFYAHYYLGLYEELLGHREAALDHLGTALTLYPDSTPQGGPAFMWQVARLQFNALRQGEKAPESEQPEPKPKSRRGSEK